MFGPTFWKRLPMTRGCWCFSSMLQVLENRLLLNPDFQPVALDEDVLFKSDLI